MPTIRSVLAVAFIINIIELSVASDNNKLCDPPCRIGYVCKDGECVSQCNPPCPDNLKCNGKGDCVDLSTDLNQVPTETVRNDIACSDVFIVKPEITSEIIPGSFTSGELSSASIMLASAIKRACKDKPEIITAGEVDVIKKCSSKIITCTIVSYHKEPSSIGQYEGVMSVKIEIFPNPEMDKPENTIQITQRGTRHWGDSVPLENAAKAVSKAITKKLRLE
jgi:hypothetical protein